MKKIFTRFLTVALLAAATTLSASAQTEEITVGTGESTKSTSPVNMYNWDRVGQSQVIYPADKLTALEGKTISALKFYMQPAIARDFAGTAIEVYVGTVDESSFAEPYTFTATDKLVKVYSGTESFSKDAAEWNLKFTTPYKYTGGNLALFISNAKGKYRRVYFRGDITDNVQSIYKTNGSASGEKFLPLTTFVCGEASGPGASVSDEAIAFPMAVVGDEAAVRTVRVTNTGTTVLTGSVVLSGSGAFSVSPAEIADLQPGATADLAFTFAPTEGGSFTAQATVSLGDAGDFDIALSGNAYSVPTGDRTVFNASNFNSALPEGWEAFALEVTTSGNFSAETKDYSQFPTTARFESRTLVESPMILWNHGNPMPYTDQFQRYFYLVSPASKGNLWLRAIASESAVVGPFVQAFEATETADGFTIGKELEMTWNQPLCNTSWATATVAVPVGSRVALFMKYAGLSVAVDSDTDGADSILADKAAEGADSSFILYDLTGKNVRSGADAKCAFDGVKPGFYILRSCNSSRKVVVR